MEENRRVMYQTRRVNNPGCGEHVVLELVEVPYDQRQRLGVSSGGARQRDVRQEDSKPGAHYKTAEIVDLF